MSGFLFRNWAELGGRRTDRGAPSILAMSAREALNWAYYLIVRYMKDEDRKTFEQNINKTASEWWTEAMENVRHEEEQRQRRIRQLAEVG